MSIDPHRYCREGYCAAFAAGKATESCEASEDRDTTVCLVCGASNFRGADGTRACQSHHRATTEALLDHNRFLVQQRDLEERAYQAACESDEQRIVCEDAGIPEIDPYVGGEERIRQERERWNAQHEAREAAKANAPTGKALRAALSPAERRVVRECALALTDALFAALDNADDLLGLGVPSLDHPEGVQVLTEIEKKALGDVRSLVLASFSTMKIYAPGLTGLVPAEAMEDR